MAIRTSDQISIVDLTDGYSVLLTNDSHTFLGDTSKAIAASTQTTVIAMCGASQVAASVNLDDVVKPTGVNVTKDTDATQPTLTIAVTTAVTAGGVVDIPIQLDNGNITIHKLFTFQIAFKGQTGAAGSSAQWYTGTKITGTSTTATIFSDSGITAAKVGDMYLNTSTQNTYRCTVAGAADVAKWVYVSNIKGATGGTGSSAQWYTGTGITGTSTTATIFSGSGVANAKVGDMYLNTSTQNTYRCTVAGAADVAKWVYVSNTNSGFSVQNGLEKDIFVLSMPVIIDEQSYSEGVDITQEQLFAALREKRGVHSSQPSPGDLTEMWDNILGSGWDELVYIPMSSGLSGSCQTARQLAMDYGGKVVVADNHRISVTLYESVLEARRMADAGMGAYDIAQHLEAHAVDSSIYITVDSLEYLKRSGRVTPAGAAIANVLNLKPVLTIQGGKLDAYAKVRGMKNSQKRMIAATADDLVRRFGDFHPDQIRIGAAGTFENPDDAKRWTWQLAEAFPQYHVYYQPLSCSIACHVGIDAAGLGISCITISEEARR